MMRYLLKFSLLTAMLFGLPGYAAPQEASGITLSQFRLIYPAAEKKGVTWSLTNNTTRAWLMQSWIRPLDSATGLPAAESDNKGASAAIPLLVTPPLKRVDAGEALTLRIRLTELSLPKDRESVFYLTVKGIPSVPDKEKQTGEQLVVAVANNIKLFYRPEGLPAGGVAKAATQLHFSLQGDAIVVDNPTPFYINFSQLTVGGQPLPADALRKLVPPRGQLRYTIAKGNTRGAVEWQVMDENSQSTPVQRQAL